MDLETALFTLDLLVQDKAINDAVRKECTDLILARIKNSKNANVPCVDAQLL